MSLPAPHVWELAVMLVGLVLIVVAARLGGWRRLSVWPVRFAGLLAFVVGGVLVLTLPGALIAQAPLAPVPQAVVYAPAKVSVELVIYDEPSGGAEVATLTPAYFSFPAHTAVTLTVVSYDTRPSPPAAYYAQVRGTTGGRAMVDGRAVSRVAVDRIAHTVTVPAMGLNVPVPIARPGHPARVMVHFTTPAAGIYDWLCTCPCGLSDAGWGYPMMQAGMMRGAIRVG